MAQQIFSTQPPIATVSGPGVPEINLDVGSNNASVYVDPRTLALTLRDPNGYRRGTIFNQSVAAQAIVAATRTYLAGSQILIPAARVQVGTTFEWTWSLTKTGAGVAASTIDIAFGTAGTTADTARVAFAKPGGTAVIDEAQFTVRATVRNASNSGIVVGTMAMLHNLSATGHAQIPAVVVTTISSAFDLTVANLIAGICFTSGAADAVTAELVQAQAWNL